MSGPKIGGKRHGVVESLLVHGHVRCARCLYIRLQPCTMLWWWLGAMKPNLVALTDLYPSDAAPNLGTFVESSWARIAKNGRLEVRLIVPNAIPPFPFGRLQAYAGRNDLPECETRSGIEVARPRFTLIPRVGWLSTPARMARSALPLSANADLIVGDFLHPAGVAAARLARLLQRPLILRAYGSDVHYWGNHPIAGPAVRAALGSASRIYAVSDSLRRQLLALGAPPDRTRTLYSGVDTKLFRPVNREAACRTLGWPRPMALCVGHLIPRKAFDRAIRAVMACPGVHLRIIGDGPERARLQRLIDTGGAADRIRLLGALLQTEVAHRMAAADVLILPSNREGLANVTLEALACGTPVIVTPVEGAAELLDGQAAGRIVAANPTAIAQALRAVLDAQLPVASVQAAIVDRFDWNAHVDAFVSDCLTLWDRASTNLAVQPKPDGIS
jgi:teichuronic acid biosynthesis glycosyltransferase TuaC